MPDNEQKRIDEMDRKIKAMDGSDEYRRAERYNNQYYQIMMADEKRIKAARRKGRVVRLLFLMGGLVAFASIFDGNLDQNIVGVKFLVGSALFVVYGTLRARNTKSLPERLSSEELAKKTSETVGYELSEEDKAIYKASFDLWRQREQLEKEHKRHEEERQKAERLQRMQELSAQIEANRTPKQRNRENPTICPRCGSSNTMVAGDRTKVSVGGAIVGAAAGEALGGALGSAIGAGVGAVGKHVTKMVCRDCGARWEFKS